MDKEDDQANTEAFNKSIFEREISNIERKVKKFENHIKVITLYE